MDEPYTYRAYADCGHPSGPYRTYGHLYYAVREGEGATASLATCPPGSPVLGGGVDINP
ncbi:hypothetical protein [Streptomyces sp. NPDC029554]|uniref:hypothetical protein n=1 Tax=Streptomyces TaxID=1883 RepID=UPI0033F28E36